MRYISCKWTICTCIFIYLDFVFVHVCMYYILNSVPIDLAPWPTNSKIRCFPVFLATHPDFVGIPPVVLHPPKKMRRHRLSTSHINKPILWHKVKDSSDVFRLRFAGNRLQTNLPAPWRHGEGLPTPPNKKGATCWSAAFVDLFLVPKSI